MQPSHPCRISPQPGIRKYNLASLCRGLFCIIMLRTFAARTSLRRASPRNFRTLSSSASVAMSQLDINSKYRMNSGHEIPVLGFGVRSIPNSFRARWHIINFTVSGCDCSRKTRRSTKRETPSIKQRIHTIQAIGTNTTQTRQ